MSPIPFRRRTTTLALLLALANVPAGAFTLGDLRLQSFLGQPLRAVVPYRKAVETGHPEPRCLSIQAAENEIPLPLQIQLRVREQEQSIEILSAGAINEPIVGFVLRANCDGQNFSRSYTVFLDPEPLVSSPATAIAIEPTPPALPPPATIKPAPLQRWPSKIVVDSEASVTELAAHYYPEGSKQHQRLVRAITATNPGIVSTDTPLPAGTKLRTSRPTPPKPKPIISDDRLTLVAEEPGNRPAKPQIKSAEDPLLALQGKVDAMQELQLKMETEIQQLRLSLAILSASSASTAAALAAREQAQASAVATAVPETLAGLPFWVWLIGGLSGIAGLSFWLGRHGRIASGYTARPAAPVTARVNVLDTHFGIAREPVTEISVLHQREGGIEVAEDESDIDRAEFLLAEGEVEEAITLLYKVIDENEQDIERWLILFHVFRERMMRAEYAQLAQRFQKLPPEAEDWDLVCNLGRKIDPENSLYERIPPAAPAPQQNPLDFLVEAEAAAPPTKIELNLPPLPPSGEPLISFEEPESDEPPPRLPEEEKTKTDSDDDFAKPCRY